MSELIDNSTIETLFEKISSLISNAQQKIASTVNLTMVYTYFGIGRIIIENEQDGNIRAAYGKQVLQKLSDIKKGCSRLPRQAFYYILCKIRPETLILFACPCLRCPSTSPYAIFCPRKL